MEGEDDSRPDDTKGAKASGLSGVPWGHSCEHMSMSTELQSGRIYLKFNKIDF